MALLERTYTIPLRRDFIKVPKHRRAKRAISEIKAFIVKHMKTDDVRIGQKLNLSIWENGIKNPPGKVKVKAIKTQDYVTVELEGFEYIIEKIQTEKTQEAKGLKGKLQQAMNVDKADSKDKSEPAKEDKPKVEKKAESFEEKKTEPVKEDKPKVEKKAEKPVAEPKKAEEKPKKE